MIESSIINRVSAVGTYSVMGVHPVAFSDRSLQLQEKQKHFMYFSRFLHVSDLLLITMIS